MKKIIALIVLLIALSATYFYVQHSTSEKYVAESNSATVDEKVILLYPESGEVSFRTNMDAEPVLATTSPTIIPNNAIVHTGVGKASVLLPDNSSFSLDENTEITINYTEKKISMYQSFGTTYHRVQKLLTGSSYQVQTAGTLAAVRGTKFVVTYDLKTQKTKVAVTENRVEVSTITKQGGASATPYAEERTVVDAGKMVSVETLAQASVGKKSAMHVSETALDPVMKAVVEREKKGDANLDIIKKEAEQKKLNKQEIRKEIKRVLFKDETVIDVKREIKEGDTKKTDAVTSVTSSTTIVRDVTVRANASTSAGVTTSGVQVQPIIKAVTAPIMTEEQFFTVFEAMFIQYFYLDEIDTPCNVKVSPGDRAKIVTDYAISKNHAFTKTTLPSFSDAIDAYCVRKDVNEKIKLQARFDDEYPF